MKQELRIRLINAILASGSPSGSDIFACASKGVEAALGEKSEKKSPEEFARGILRLYDPFAQIEVLDFTGKDFDPLFAIPLISSAIRRISGFPRAILLVIGINEGGGQRRIAGKKKRLLAAENIEFLEDKIESYRKAFPNLEIIIA